MPYVISDACVGVKDASCVEQCPVDAIHPTPRDPRFAHASQLHIDPDACIDCGMCVDVCPPGAIFPSDQLPTGKERFIQLNADWFRRS